LLLAVASICILCAARFAAAESHGNGRSAAYQQFHERLHTFDSALTSRTVFQVVDAAFAEYMRTSGGCKSRDTAEVHELYRVSIEASYFTGEDRFLRAAEQCFRSLTQAKSLLRSERVRLYQAYVRHRDFVSAHTFARNNPDLHFTPLPSIHGSVRKGSPATIDVVKSGDNFSFTTEAVDASHADVVVIVASATCHFSQRAADYIIQSPVLNSILRNALWISPPDDLLRYEQIVAWNTRHPSAHLRVAMDEASFRNLDFSQTPVFFLIRNHHVLEKVVGWPSDDQAKNLIEALKRAKFTGSSTDLELGGEPLPDHLGDY